jgi:hypothetical protein
LPLSGLFLLLKRTMMSILDEHSRARNGAKALVRLITSSSSASFEQDLETYAQADGILDTGFLDELESVKKNLEQIIQPGGQEEFGKLTLPFQAALIELAIERETFDVLSGFAEATKEKKLRKEIARRIHELRGQGVRIEPVKKKRNPVRLKPAEEPQPEVMVGESDPVGDREIVYAAAIPRVGVKVLHLVTHYEEGVRDFHYFKTTRSGMRDVVKLLKKEGERRYFKVPQPVGYFLLEKARACSEAAGKPFPARFLSAISDLPKPDQVPEGLPSTDFGDSPEDHLARIVETGALHEKPEFRSWLLPRVVLEQANMKAQEIMASQLYVDDHQKHEQLEKLLVQTLDEYFEPDMRAIWIERLEEAAYLTASAGDQDEAFLALIVAAALRQEGRPASSIPFCEQLLRKVVRMPEPGAGSPPDESPPKDDPKIIIP